MVCGVICSAQASSLPLLILFVLGSNYNLFNYLPDLGGGGGGCCCIA
jgi:hypothetical protein